MKQVLLTSLFLFLLFSCINESVQNNNNKQTHASTINGYEVPKDSIRKASVTNINEATLKKVKAHPAKISPSNTINKEYKLPKSIAINDITKNSYNKNNYSLPETLQINKTKLPIVLAGTPEIVLAKDAITKDQNSQNFSAFKKLQGLKQNIISCLTEDSQGNIWIGTSGSGITKYDGKYFTHYTEKEGLSSNYIWTILVDDVGDLWIGTDGGGITKFDGTHFTHIKEINEYTIDVILCSYKDKAGNLWFGTNGGGALKFNKNTPEKAICFSEKNGLKNNVVWSIIEDRNANIWFGTDGGGASKYNGKTFTHFNKETGLCGDFIRNITEDNVGNVWFASWGDGISMFNGKEFISFTDKEGLAGNTVKRIYEDKQNNIWIGTWDGGISKLTLKNNSYSFTNYTEKEGLSINIIWDILEDKCGNLWIAGWGGGLIKYDGKTFSHYTELEGFTGSVVWSTYKDKSGNMWFGTWNAGVIKYDGHVYTQYTEESGLSNNTVWNILEDKLGNMWFTTNEGGVSKFDGKIFTHYTEKDGLGNNSVWNIMEDKKGNIWFCTNGGGITKYDGNRIELIEKGLLKNNEEQKDLQKVNGKFVKTLTNYASKEGLSTDVIWSALEDNTGTIWAGTDGGGTTKLDLTKLSENKPGAITWFTEKEGFPENIVRNIFQDSQDNIWFGLDGEGIALLTKGSTNKFIHITEKDGLTSNVLMSIYEDKEHNLWFGTRLGLSKLTPNNFKKLLDKINTGKTSEQDVFFKNYTYEDGILGIGVNGGKTIYEDNNNTLWIATNDRLTAHYPKGNLIDTISPNIQLTSLKLFNEDINWAGFITTTNLKSTIKDTTLTLGNGVQVDHFDFDGLQKWYNIPKNLSLAYDNNYLTFNFIGITTFQPKKVKYQYVLEGIDKNWSALTNKTEAHYGNLPHGFYTFKVKAMNSMGKWSNEYSYSFTIRPPWWKTWWFRISIGLLIIASIGYYIKYREQKLQREKHLLEEKVELRTSQLAEQTKVAEHQRHLVEEKHKEITDSINYAERIQRSFIATKQLLDENLNDYFVLFKPKDVVSGDFYWAATLREPQGSDSNKKFALVTADSTGHGVPGAIMSILNITSLEKAIESYVRPADILNSTRKTIIERLKKDGSPEGGKDGMDASLCVFDFKNKKLSIAAANNPVWIVRTVTPNEMSVRVGDEGARIENISDAGLDTLRTRPNKEVIEIKPDKMPVGKHDKQDISFTQHEIDLQSGDVVYTLTDGFPDQFGGPSGKKFMSKNLRELLAANTHLPMHEQKQLLEKTFADWVGNIEQVDDVTLIGVRIS